MRYPTRKIVPGKPIPADVLNMLLREANAQSSMGVGFRSEDAFTFSNRRRGPTGWIPCLCNTTKDAFSVMAVSAGVELDGELKLSVIDASSTTDPWKLVVNEENEIITGKIGYVRFPTFTWPGKVRFQTGSGGTTVLGSTYIVGTTGRIKVGAAQLYGLSDWISGTPDGYIYVAPIAGSPCPKSWKFRIMGDPTAGTLTLTHTLNGVNANLVLNYNETMASIKTKLEAHPQYDAASDIFAVTATGTLPSTIPLIVYYGTKAWSFSFVSHTMTSAWYSPFVQVEQCCI